MQFKIDENLHSDVADLLRKHGHDALTVFDQGTKQVEVAKAAWLEAAQALGKPIPSPKYQPVIYEVGQLAGNYRSSDRGDGSGD